MKFPAVPKSKFVRRHLTLGAALSFLWLFLAVAGTQADGWCTSHRLDSALRRELGLSAAACTPEGQCDQPATRNLYIADTSQPIITIRAHVVVLRNDDGSNPAASAADVTASMNQLNSDFAPARIQFDYDWTYFNSTAYRVLGDAEDFAMKCASTYKPESTLNIWVTDISDAGVLGYSYLPWSPNVLQCSYGCVVDLTSGGGFGGGRHVLTHEVGHALGLYHTFHGVDEVTQCGGCYENPNDPNADFLGDFCLDTRPTPTNYGCAEMGGTSPCTGAGWAPTDYRNYMGYAPTSCQTHFSSQQMARMRCWTNDVLSGWIQGVKIIANTVFGPAPLDVQFTGQASVPTSSWLWDFGDGFGATIQNPSHTFGPGFYDIEATIQAVPSRTYSSRRPGFISAYADTLTADSVGARPGKPVKLDVIARNYIPLTGLTIPFTWSGPMNVILDSVRTGSRTTGWALNVVQQDDINKRRTYGYDFSSGGPSSALPAGNGSVLSIWFRVPGNAQPGVVQPVVVGPYAFQVPTMIASAGTYTPELIPGGLVVCRAGDVDFDGVGPDISDLTYLIAFLFLDGPPPPITAQADCDGIPGIDIGDLSRLIDYLFISFVPVVCGS
jgi:hypothetical protein